MTTESAVGGDFEGPVAAVFRQERIGHLLKPKLTLEIVKRPDDLHAFKVLPRR